MPVVPVERPVTWAVTVLPEIGGSPYRAADEQDGNVDVFGGGLRLSVHGDHVEWARDVTLHPIVGHARDGDHWLFATADGALFRSTEFAGPLERVGVTAPGWSLCTGSQTAECAGFDSTGVLAVRSASGRLFLGTGRDGLAPARAPMDRSLVDTGFVDREFGVGVFAPGVLFRTVDGGAHVERVDLGSDVPFVVYPHGDSFVLATTRGLLRLDRTGSPVPFAGTPDAFDHALAEEAARAIEESLPHDDPLLWPTLLTHGAILLADDRVATLEGDSMVLRTRDGEGAHVDLPGSSCALHPFGSQVLAACESSRRSGMILEAFTEDRGTELHTFADTARVLAAPDGGGIVVLRACSDDDPRPRDGTPVCWFNGVSWQPHVLPSGARLVGLHGESLLYESRPADDDMPRGATYRVARASTTDDGEPVTVPGATLLSLSFAANGSLVGVAERDGHFVLAIGESGAPLGTRALPSGVTRVAFVDARRGIAVGRRLTEVHATVDGGQTWTRPELPVDGDASSVMLREPGSNSDDGAGDDPTCTATYCSVDGRWLWSAPGVVRSNNVRLLAALRAPPEASARDRITDPLQQGYSHGRFACDLRTVPSDAPAELPAGRLYGTDGWLDPHVRAPTDGGAGRYAFAWGGLDDAGSFRATARAVTLPPVDLSHASSAMPVSNSDSILLYPRLLTRSLALLERCAVPFLAGQCDLVAIPARGTPTVIGTLHTLLGADDIVSHTRGAIALPDGGAAVFVSTAYPTYGTEDRSPARLDALLRLSPRGEVVARRTFAWGRTRTVRMLARNAHGPGLVVATAPDVRALTWFGLDAATDGSAVAELAAAPLSVCTTEAPPADAVTFVSAEAEYAPSLDIANGRFILLPPYNAHAYFEATAGHVCLRGESFWTMNPADELLTIGYLGGPPRLRANHGSLEGQVAGVARARPMRCDVQ